MWLGAVSVAHYLGLSRRRPHARGAAAGLRLRAEPAALDLGRGRHAVALDYLLPRDVVQGVRTPRRHDLAAVPPLWVQLAEQDWPGERGARCAADQQRRRSAGALVRRLRALFPDARLFPMYGLTEAFRSTYLDPALVDAHPDLDGQGDPVRRDPGGRRRRQRGGAQARRASWSTAGPLVAQGYWQDPARTAERFSRRRPSRRMAARRSGRATGAARRRTGCSLSWPRDAMIKSAATASARRRSRRRRSPAGVVARRSAWACPTSGSARRSRLIAVAQGRRCGANVCAPSSGASCRTSCSRSEIRWRRGDAASPERQDRPRGAAARRSA